VHGMKRAVLSDSELIRVQRSYAIHVESIN